MFFALKKVDAESRMVWGIASDETPDKQREICDYEKMKPYVQKWNDDFSLKTAGLSLGPLRSMHKGIAAGVIKKFEFDDAAKTMRVGVKVVDDVELNKCMEGVYTGFSFGGNYVSREPDQARKGYTRVVIDPFELSLCDMPCNPSANFDVMKAEGIIETQSFKISPREDVNPKEGENKYGNVKFADMKNKKYPIDTEAHIRAAWNYINKSKNAAEYGSEDVGEIKKHIVSTWKEKIDPKGPPSAAKKVARSVAKKSLWQVSSLAQTLDGLVSMAGALEAERDREGDDSDVPERFMAAVETLGEIFQDMASEEADEAIESMSASS